ncbi:MAG TPA: tetratricopeptide repeat protein [Bryobacteraceae bacterium]|jgi:tetratricopeptide (TPR) repeat protein|nr:tetratricopeptide repeat protein [Bryobacteraceae bacterium]
MLPVLLLSAFFAAGPSALETARDAQDRPALQRIASEFSAAADKAPNDAEAQHRAAIADSYLAEVALEVRDKKLAEDAAGRGIKPAERAVALKPEARYYVTLGTLYGQVIPANVLMGLSYGKKCKDAIQKAIELDPKLATAYEARGVGNYYLPAQLGGGFDIAITDFRKAIELDPKRAEAYLWLGLSLRKQNKNAEARQAFQKGLELDPSRVWIKQQLDKTPAQ